MNEEAKRNPDNNLTMMKNNVLGSEVFGTTQIKTDEYVLLAKTIIENGSTVEHAALDISAIDDMLSMLRIECIVNSQRYTEKGKIRKNSSLLDMMSNRIDQLILEHHEC